MDKKSLIMEKAIDLFAENGIETTSVQQITERCGISKGAFYLYFKSKDELILSLIDHFMSSFITRIEQSVSKEVNGNQLYRFLHELFSQLKQHVHFAKIFMKEPVFTVKKEYVERVQFYSQSINQLLFNLLKKQFPDIQPFKYDDLLFSVNGFVKSYMDLFFQDHYPVDINLLCDSIIEKTTLIAEYAKIPFISPDSFVKRERRELSIRKEQLIAILKEGIQKSKEDPLIAETFKLLMENLENPQLNVVIIQGLLNTLRTKDSYRWISYLYDAYIKTI